MPEILVNSGAGLLEVQARASLSQAPLKSNVGTASLGHSFAEACGVADIGFAAVAPTRSAGVRAWGQRRLRRA